MTPFVHELRNAADYGCQDPWTLLYRASERIEMLEALLKEAAIDLTGYVEIDWPAERRSQYPSIENKWRRDMALVWKIQEVLNNG